MENKNEVFNYTYSPYEQEEIRAIRKRYMPKEEDKMATLRRLDASVTERAMIVSLILGVVGVLIFGLGMCFCLVWDMLALGIIIGAVGVAVMVPAYPIYIHISEKQRERVAPEILRLTEELLK